MANAHDVAAYILDEIGEPISTWKLQKLVYYSQAWQLAWEDRRLFDERIEAWANGPVVRDLYSHHRGEFTVKDWRWGDLRNLREDERDTVDAVLAGYGQMSGRELSHLTHSERPWQEARAGLGPTDRSNTEIDPDVMKDFYSALDADRDAPAVGEIDWSRFTF